jgi:hypothetical protein
LCRYPSGIPADIQSPTNSKVTKKELIFVRNDIYFYNQSLYQNPANLNLKYVITLDRYTAYTGACASPFGSASSVVQVAGYFNVSQSDGLKPNEWSNEILMNCDRVKLSYDQVIFIIKMIMFNILMRQVETASGGSIKKVHYLVPVVDGDLKQADNIQNFTNNGDGTGYMTGYPEIQFIFGHALFVSVSPNNTRQGGKFKIYLPSGVNFKNQSADPVANGWVTYSADQVFLGF